MTRLRMSPFKGSLTMRLICQSVFVRLFVAAVLATTANSLIRAEDTAPSPEKQELYKQLEKRLTNAKLSGRFTVIGKEGGELPKEEYTILSATKVEQGEMWLLKARIKYGDKDA